MKTQRKIMSILLVAAMLCTTLLTSAFTVSAATTGSQVYFDNSAYNWENVYVYAYFWPVPGGMPDGSNSLHL